MWDFIEKGANALQLLVAVPILYAAFLWTSRNWRYKRQLRKAAARPSTRPVALSITTRGSSLVGAIENYFKDVGREMEVREVLIKESVTQDNILTCLKRVIEQKELMNASGVTEVHLFLQCPVAFAAAVGALLDNWVTVYIYHFNHELTPTTYEIWAPLHKGTVPGLGFGQFKDVLDELS